MTVLGGAGVLAACGGDDGATDGAPDAAPDPADTGTDAATQTPADGQTPGGGGGQALATTTDVPEGGGVIVGDAVVTQPAAGEYKAFSSTCTHQGCTVASVEGGTINCACHGSRFDIETGAVANGPATEPLPEIAVTVDGETIRRA